MFGEWVVDFVHGKGCCIVIDRNVHGATYGKFNARACAAPASEGINYQFVVNVTLPSEAQNLGCVKSRLVREGHLIVLPVQVTRQSKMCCCTA
jgi:hypothetical protein